MSKEYHWRDGWFLTYPHPLPPVPVVIPKENINNCKCGNRTYGESPCIVCYLLDRRGK